MRRPFLALTVFACAVAHAQYPGSQPVPAKWKPGFESITLAEGTRVLSTLAGPNFRGRSPYNGDFGLAAGWVAGYLQANGIAPAGDEGSYFHRFDLVTTQTKPESTFLKTLDGKITIPFGKDFVIAGSMPGTYTTPKLAFVSGGREASIEGLDVRSLKGCWVILTEEARANGPLVTAIRKIVNEEAGDTRILTVRESASSAQPGANFTGVGHAPGQPLNYGPILISPAQAQNLAKHFAASSYLNPSAAIRFEKSAEGLRLELDMTRTVTPCVNVIGKIEGTDAALKDEAVFVGSHLDHLGPQTRGIHYGADDNASGCTANLLIARAIKMNPLKPKRTVIFAWWNLEESGLFGSQAYVQRPTHDLKNVIAYLNMDMVGRNEDDPRFGETPEKNTTSVYTGSVPYNSNDLYQVLLKANAFVQLRLKQDYEDRTFRSDTRNFVMHGIPTLKAFTGEHRDYHREGDVIEKINFQKMVNVAKWLYVATQELAAAPTKPKFERTPFVPAKRGG